MNKVQLLFAIIIFLFILPASAHDNEFCENSFLCGEICHDIFEAAGIEQDSPSCANTCPYAYLTPDLPYTFAYSVPCSSNSCKHYCNQELPPELGDNGDCVGGSEGCPVWKVNQQNLNVYAKDTPIWYESPVGPDVRITLSYNSRDENVDRHGVGRKWVLSYASYLERKPLGLTVYLADGDNYFYSVVADEDGFFEPFPGIYSTLTLNGSEKYEFTEMDGTTFIYDSIGSNPDHFQLVSLRDVNGKSLTFSYQNDKLTTITDALGRITTLTYTGDRLTSVADPFGRQATLSHDAAGDLVSITDMGGLTSTINYDADGYISSINKPQFGAWQFDVEPSDQIAGDSYPAPGSDMGDNYRVTVTDPEQNKTEYFFNAANSETWVVQPNQYTAYQSAAVNNSQQSKMIYRYSDDFPNNGKPGRFRLETEINELGHETTYQYNTKGRKTHINLLSNELFPTYLRWENFSYNDANQLVQQDSYSLDDSNSRDYRKYEYLEPQTQLVTHVRTPSVYVYSDGSNYDRLTYTEYDANRYTDAVTVAGVDKIGNVVYTSKYDFSYNDDGQLTALDGPRTDLTDVASWTHFNCSNPSDPNCGQPASYQNAVGHTVTYDAYTAGGLLAQTTDANGLVTQFDYDNLNRLIKQSQYPVANPANKRETVLTYRGAKDHVASVQYPDGMALTLSYDTAERLTGITDNWGNQLTYQYDSTGNLVQRDLLDEQSILQNRLEMAYDLVNRQTALKNDTSIESFAYDGRNRLTAQVDANGNTAAQMQYNGLGRLKENTDALNGDTRYTYDPTGQLAEVRAPNNARTTYHFNDLGHLLEETSPDRGTTTYTYDEAGNAISKTDARGVTVTFTYDALNRLTHTIFPDASENSSYVYDNCTNGVGRLCSSTDASGTTSYQYDPWGNIIQVNKVQKKLNGDEIGSYTTYYAYDEGNRLTEQHNPSGLIINYQRDSIGRVTQVTSTWQGNTSTLISNRSYRADGRPKGQTYGNGIVESKTYDLQGRLIQQSLNGLSDFNYAYDANGNLLSKDVTATGTTATFNYDVLNRLNSETGGVGQQQITYDPNGNRLNLNVNGDDYAHSYEDDSNRLTQVAAWDNTLDAAGNTLSDFGGTRHFSYNQRNQLSEFRNADDSLIVAYGYDYQNLRTHKEAQIGGATGSNLLINYQYDLKGQLLERYFEGNALQQSYVWLDGAPIAKIELTPAGEQTILYLVTDHLMTPRYGLNQSGAVTWLWDSDGFGRLPAVADPDGDGVNEEMYLRFPGQYYDIESGLHYNWHRYYDPKVGRYITSDPIGLLGGLSTFGYVRGNPLGYFDSNGFDPSQFFRGELQIPLISIVSGGGGVTVVSCDDACEKRRTFLYYKVCFGASTGASAVGGVVSGLDGTNCEPENYSGYFLEGAAGALGVSGAVDIGLTDANSNYIPDGFSGVNEAGIGAGTPGIGVQLCYYVFIKEL